MRGQPIKPVENYTNPFLVMFGLVLFMALFAVWAIFGYAVSLLSGYVMHRLIRRLSPRG